MQQTVLMLNGERERECDGFEMKVMSYRVEERVRRE